MDCKLCISHLEKAYHRLVVALGHVASTLSCNPHNYTVHLISLFLFLLFLSFTKGKKLSAHIDRTVDEMHWPPGSNHQDTQEPLPKSAATTSSSKSGFHELKSVSPSSGKKSDDTDSEDGDVLSLENERCCREKNSFDLSVLIGEAHSLIRFSLFHRVPPESDSQDLAALPLSDSSSDTSEDECPDGKPIEIELVQERKGSHEDVGVKPPKISNILQPQHQTVTMEY